jgi:holo-[acyl-carrier protein] synthase
MRIVGHGIDLVETQRIERMLADHGERFLERCFTPREMAYLGNLREQAQHLAGRFAAKEAILKVLGTGWSHGIAWTDAEVPRQPSGQPTVVLHGKCLEVAHALGITAWWISISHIKTHAMASAIAVAPA